MSLSTTSDPEGCASMHRFLKKKIPNQMMGCSPQILIKFWFPFYQVAEIRNLIVLLISDSIVALTVFHLVKKHFLFVKYPFPFCTIHISLSIHHVFSSPLVIFHMPLRNPSLGPTCHSHLYVLFPRISYLNHVRLFCFPLYNKL